MILCMCIHTQLENGILLNGLQPQCAVCTCLGNLMNFLFIKPLKDDAFSLWVRNARISGWILYRYRWLTVVVLLSTLQITQQICPLGSHCLFCLQLFACMWLSYSLQYTWKPEMAERKVNTELSLSVMLTGKCCVDSFVYSGLSIYGCQTNFILHWVRSMNQNMQNHSNLFESKGKWFLTHSN